MTHDIIITLAILKGHESIMSAMVKGLITRKGYESVYDTSHAMMLNHWTVNPDNGNYIPVQRVPGWIRRVR